MPQQTAIVIERLVAVFATVRGQTTVDVRVQMIVERGLCEVPSAAHVTQVRPFSDVRFDVIDERGLAAERARTVCASQRLVVARVRLQMVTERTRLAERFAANVTLVRSVSGVHTSVHRQSRRGGKSFQAHVARRRRRRHYRFTRSLTGPCFTFKT